MTPTYDDIRDGVLLARAAYADVSGSVKNAEDNIIDLGLATRGWQWKSPTDFGFSSIFIDSNAYYRNLNGQALVAYNSGTHTLAVAFRGTEIGGATGTSYSKANKSAITPRQHR